MDIAFVIQHESKVFNRNLLFRYTL